MNTTNRSIDATSGISRAARQAKAQKRPTSGRAWVGGIDVIVPEGIQVDLTGIAIMGGKESRLKGGKVLPGSQIVRLKALCHC